MEMNDGSHILLTGAGFTKNFGGPLAKELWSIIFSNPALDAAPVVRDILRRDFDFESVYNAVMLGPMLPVGATDTGARWRSQQQALRKAVNDAYDYIDEKVRGFVFRRDAPYPVNIYKVQDFLARFAGTVRDPGFFFTLNQDLFVERQYYNGPRPVLPGIQHCPTWFTPDGTQTLGEERCIISGLSDDVKFTGSPFCYVKLHGSSNWYTADQETMVIGQAKQAQIASQPILASYFDAFRAVLAKAGRRLLCVGYSFSDGHINDAIREGVQAGLRVYVMSPESPDVLAARLKAQQETGEIVWRGLAGYFQTDLKMLFPADQSETAEWKLLRSRFFQS
jgi:hypothetical protein